MKRDELALRITYAFLFAAIGFYGGPNISESLRELIRNYFGIGVGEKSSEKGNGAPKDDSSWVVEENRAERGQPDDWHAYHEGNLSRSDAEKLTALMFDPVNENMTWRIRRVPPGYSAGNVT